MNEKAFPNTGDGTWAMEPSPGMDLRDYFAGQALAGLLSGMLADGSKFGTETPKNMALTAYLTADAMLEARGEA